MPRLVIISERTRYHFQKPLEYFRNIEIIHLYKYYYPDMDPKEFPNLIRYKNIFDLYQKLIKLKPDLIQGLEPYYGYSRFKIPLRIIPILLTTYIFCKKTKTPYFFHILENILPEKKYGLLVGWKMKCLAKIYANGAKFIFYLNQGAKKNLLHLGIKENKIFSGLWGIWGVSVGELSPKKIKNHPPRLARFDSARQAEGEAGKSKIKNIVFVGRLIEQKGLIELLEAFNEVNKKFLDTRLIIVGDGPLKKKLQATSYKLSAQGRPASGWQANVKFVGQVTNDQVGKYFQSAYITVSPTRSLSYSAEQIGVTNLESMAHGVPVISTLSGSIPEYVIDGKTGLLVPENNAKALELAVRKLLDDEHLRNQLATSCYQYAKENFDAKKNIQELEKFLLDEINGK